MDSLDNNLVSDSKNEKKRSDSGGSINCGSDIM